MAPPPDQPGRTGIVDGRLTYDRRTNPRRTACPWCKAPIAAPCRDVRGRDLSWYHADRHTAADTTTDPDPAPLPAPVAPTPRTGARQRQRTSQPAQAATEPTRGRDVHRRGDLGHARTRHQSCADWLTHQLTQHGGTLPAHDLINAANTAGYSRTTLHRTRTRLGITTTRHGYQGHLHWNLSPPDLEPKIPDTALQALTQAGQMTLAINTRARARRGSP